uniref:Uncharacterized protein n=1 Tax=viral metagenome TaxID=1070528 RepID=A0A6C0D774_9ZZZZ
MAVNYDSDTTENIKLRLKDLKNSFDTVTTSPRYNNAETGEVKDALVALQTRLDTNPATELHEADDSFILIQKSILEAQEDLKIAEERVKTMRNVDKNPSYYESWFPINRPLRSSSIIVCFIFGIFFFSLSFFSFMKYLGFSFTVNISWLTSDVIQTYRKFFVYGGGFIVIGLIILTIIGWVRKS